MISISICCFLFEKENNLIIRNFIKNNQCLLCEKIILKNSELLLLLIYWTSNFYKILYIYLKMKIIYIFENENMYFI